MAAKNNDDLLEKGNPLALSTKTKQVEVTEDFFKERQQAIAEQQAKKVKSHFWEDAIRFSRYNTQRWRNAPHLLLDPFRSTDHFKECMIALVCVAVPGLLALWAASFIFSSSPKGKTAPASNFTSGVIRKL